MYADDLLSIGKDESEIRKAMTIVEMWAKSKNMGINYQKSGVMVMYKNKPRKPPTELLQNFPYVNSYKYLGTLINNSMRIESHLADIQTRASHIERTLLPFRINSSPRFNLNFFKILIGPHFRLMGSSHLIERR
eukprot:GHVR01170696.1.p1 GENE.GHVR01170696.1~~GHVR01170696.1.p1  ORF type:complete len:134 (+),score=4.98 GHVR01170696.1:144-545(+)